MRSYALFISLFAFTTSVQACPVPPASVKFQGTAFESQPLEITGNKIRFFRGTWQEVAVYYNSSFKKWCYGSRKKSPQAACLSHAKLGGKVVLMAGKTVIESFTLENVEKKVVASLTFKDNQLTIEMRDSDGKTNGKRIVIEDKSSSETESLEIHGWNCPNPKFLSCAGAELRTIGENIFEQEMNEELAVKEVELSSRLVRYASTCEGLHQLPEKKSN